MSDTCSGTTADGEPCTKATVDGSKYCQWHGSDEECAPSDDEQVALQALHKAIQDARSEATRTEACRVLLKHLRRREP